ncbi:hypothetical protein [Scytonema hofmannii]|uniref:hypothetical protein n=1 Tax=Scytonema hofmannii TaxID=34078 RepID=UPI0011E05A20|nr:hypothetical protein [Scytonema hofmannii]
MHGTRFHNAHSVAHRHGFNKKGRRQRAEGRRDLSLLPDTQSIAARLLGARGLSPPPRIFDLVVNNNGAGLNPHLIAFSIAAFALIHPIKEK